MRAGQGKKAFKAHKNPKSTSVSGPSCLAYSEWMEETSFGHQGSLCSLLDIVWSWPGLVETETPVA